MNKMKYSKIEQILSNMELKDVSRQNSSISKVIGNDDNYNVVLFSKKDDDRAIYSVKIIPNNPSEEIGDLYFEHIYAGKNNGDAQALFCYTQFALNRLNPFYRKTGTSQEYDSDNI